MCEGWGGGGGWTQPNWQPATNSRRHVSRKQKIRSGDSRAPGATGEGEGQSRDGAGGGSMTGGGGESVF